MPVVLHFQTCVWECRFLIEYSGLHDIETGADEIVGVRYPIDEGVFGLVDIHAGNRPGILGPAFPLSGSIEKIHEKRFPVDVLGIHQGFGFGQLGFDRMSQHLKLHVHQKDIADPVVPDETAIFVVDDFDGRIDTLRLDECRRFLALGDAVVAGAGQGRHGDQDCQ
ncbi:hypothetical protein DESC_600020 [Desulfosarcina cetonica]|nr:hypothetical protein DESC_600020 [Desulfosarcina cetonica]